MNHAAQRSHGRLSRRRRGAILAMALAVLLVVSLMSAALVKHVVFVQRQSTWSGWQQQSKWLAISAAERARAQLRADANYAGESWRIAESELPGNSRSGIAIIRVDSLADKIHVEARYPEQSAGRSASDSALTVLEVPLTLSASGVSQ